MGKVKFGSLAGLACLLAFAIAAGPDVVPIQHVEGLNVFEANGKRLGPVLSFSPLTPNTDQLSFGAASASPVVAFKVGDNLLVVAVARDRFFGTERQVYFESTDCSGTPLFDASVLNTGFPGLLPRSVVLSDGTPYVQDPDESSLILSVTTHSFQAGEFVPSPHCVAGENTLDVVRAKQVTNLHQDFQPPFTLRALR